MGAVGERGEALLLALNLGCAGRQPPQGTRLPEHKSNTDLGNTVCTLDEATPETRPAPVLPITEVHKFPFCLCRLGAPFTVTM